MELAATLVYDGIVALRVQLDADGSEQIESLFGDLKQFRRNIEVRWLVVRELGRGRYSVETTMADGRPYSATVELAGNQKDVASTQDALDTVEHTVHHAFMDKVLAYMWDNRVRYLEIEGLS
jgi:hypothetical protein